MRIKQLQNVWWIALIAFGLIGALFSAVSAYDFIVHLDRQTHAISCAFVPGLGAPDATGSSGCYATLMSPYSSVFRELTWGGIPIALPSFCVFAYLLFLTIDLMVRQAKNRVSETRFLVLATALPVVMSIVYFIISISEIGTLCKNCVGIYLGSIGAFVSAILVYLCAKQDAPADQREKTHWRQYGFLFGEGVVFVVLPVIAYLLFKPPYTDAMARCGELLHQEDKYGVRIKLSSSLNARIPAVELFDPLCPACRAFQERLTKSDLGNELAIDGVVFPLDKECNWMISTSLHPGACAVSEALICAGDNPLPVLEWAFANQEQLLKIAATDTRAVYREIEREFPALANCIGKPAVKSRINKSLRWIVSNSAQIMVPQLFIDGQKLCSEDMDLGLEFALDRAITAQKTQKPRSNRLSLTDVEPRKANEP